MRNLLAPRSFPGAEGIVSVATGSVQATMQLSAVIAEKIKHKHSQKESNFPLPSLTSALPPCSRPLEFIQPLATRAEAWQAIPGVSEWVMGIIRPVAIVDILTYRTIYGYERDHFWCRDILRLIHFL